MSFLERLVSNFNIYVQILFGGLMSILALIILWLGIEVGSWQLAVFAFFIMSVTAVWLIMIQGFRESFKIDIKETEFGILTKKNGDFSRFLPKGEHFVSPKAYDLAITLPEKGNKATGDMSFRTLRGIRVRVMWETKYNFIRTNVLDRRLNEEEQKVIGYAIIKAPFGKLAGMGTAAMREIIGRKTIRQLFEYEKEGGCLMNELEEELTNSLRAKLNLGDEDNPILDEESVKIQVKGIFFPDSIEREIEAYWKKQLYTPPYKPPFPMEAKPSSN